MPALPNWLASVGSCRHERTSFWIFVRYDEFPSQSNTEGDCIPVERPDFKSGEARLARLVGSTPTPFRPHPELMRWCMRRATHA